MSNLRLIAGIAGLLLATSTIAADIQDYPTRPIRIVTSSVGSGNDLAARIIAQGLSVRLGQPVIVDNRPSGVVLGTTVPNAAPDGYTLLVGGELLWVSAFLQKIPYDPVRDFTAITRVLTLPNVLVVTPTLPVKSVRDLIDLAKIRKGDLDYGTASTGGSAHLAAELFKSMAGVSMVRISHKSSADMINSALSGQVPVAFATMTSGIPHIKSGKLRGVAVTSSRPSELLPGLPTVADTLPGYTAGGDVVMLAPPKVPTAIINRLNRETVQIINMPDVKERFLNAGGEVEGSSPQALTTWIRSEMTRWGKVLKDAGITPEKL
jgi:tripartite-type tricarboxylate transporter receptor subunit TctC